MAEERQGLSDLRSAVAAQAPKAEPKRDKFGRSYATGKRKNAVARVWVKPGKGKITVNDRTFENYFVRPVLRMMIQQPLVAAARNGQYDVICTVAGGRSEYFNPAMNAASLRVSIDGPMRPRAGTATG